LIAASPDSLGDLVSVHVIRAEPVAMSIAVAEQAALQHLVGGGTDARHEVRRIEGRLFYFGEIVFGIAIQNDSAN